MYTCAFCGNTSSTCNEHLKHLRYHRNLTKNVHCGYQACKKSFSAENLLRMHLIRFHRVKTSVNKVVLKSNEVAANANAKFTCNLDFCNKEHYTYQALIKHLKDHVRCGLKVRCPFLRCESRFEKINSFTGHLSKVHRKSDVLSCATQAVAVSQVSDADCSQRESDGEDASVRPDNSRCRSVQTDFSRNLNEDPAECDEELPLNANGGNSGVDDDLPFPKEQGANEEDLFVMNLAFFYLKLECHFLVPASTVQYIYDELSELHETENHLRSERLKMVMSNENISAEKTENILRYINNNDPFRGHNKFLKTDYRRKQFYKDRLHFVSPKEIPISQGGHFHYVSILDTCKAILNDPSLELVWDTSPGENDIMRDFIDGEVFRYNPFFQGNPRSLRLILFQDSFVLSNPIGPARSDGKILAVYMICGNIPLHQRSQVKRISLVALCKEKEFDHSQVYGRIVDDLQILETRGIINSQGEIIKGSLAFIIGDNLGSHALGGLVQNFSRVDFFCRFCLARRADVFQTCTSRHLINENQDDRDRNDLEENEEEAINFEEMDVGEENDGCTGRTEDEREESETDEEVVDEVECEYDDTESEEDTDEPDTNTDTAAEEPYHVHYFPVRTPDSYNEALRKIGSANNYQGVKFNSVFNKLQNYHVCMPGLPPCLGHDGPEGVMTYDVPLFIRHFVKKKWFTYDELNRRISKFRYSSVDQRDKPKPVKDGKASLIGGAWQIWTFVRLLPLLIGGKIKNAQDPVWIALLTLTEIFEIICSPRIHKSFIPYLQDRINTYLSMRTELFRSVKLRPKHHFLQHYPWLISKFGPLMRVFTLRCESKHFFFKRVIHSIRCFKNLTYSLSEKHELLQSYVRSGGDTKESDGLVDVSQLNRRAFSDGINAAIVGAGLNGMILEGSSAKLNGHKYRKGNVVVVRQNLYQYEVVFGRITLILQDEREKVYFVLEIVESVFRPKLRLYELGAHMKFSCIAFEDLYTHEPQDIYVQNTGLFVKLTHGLVANRL